VAHGALAASTVKSTLALAAGLWSGAMAVIAVVGGLAAAAGPEALRDGLGFTFPARARLVDFAVVALHNLGLVGALLVAARRPRLSIDLFVALSSVANVVLVGLALGGYGARLIEHAAAYGVCELAGFSFTLAIYIDARRGRHPPTRVCELLAALLVVFAAALETVVGVRL
jgi:hypothetical protein